MHAVPTFAMPGNPVPFSEDEILAMRPDDAHKAREHNAAIAEQRNAPPVEVKGLRASLTDEEKQAAQHFAKRASAASKHLPSPGLHLTWQQLDDLRADDPEGFAAWARAPRTLNLRSED